MSLNSSAVRNPELISQSSKEFGTQCIVIALMLEENLIRLMNGKYM